jgi:O-antigen ligase
MTKTENYIFLALKILLFLVPVSLLIVCPGYFCKFNLFFPFITGKALFFRILIELSFLLLAFLIFNNKNFLPKKNEFLFWTAIFFLVVIIIVNFFSLRPYLSFWGNAERSEGVWALLHFILWFLILWIVFKIDPSFKKIIFYSFLLVLYLISFIEIQQGLILKESRPSSTLGNATFVGFFANLMIFICLYFIFQASKSEKIFIGLGIILALVSILISQTRGAILGVTGGLFIFGLVYFLSSKTKTSFKILGLVLVILSLISFYQFLQTDYALKIPGINRVAESLKNKETYMARWLSWQIFLNSWQEKPLVGYGLENSPIAYFKHFNPEVFKYEEAIFDRPHNKYIEILVTTGLIGAGAWLIFYLIIFFTIFKNERHPYLRASLCGFFVGYLIQNFTLFDIQASYLPFFFGLSLLSIPSTNNFKKESLNDNLILPLQVLVSGLVIIGLLINFYHFYFVYQIIKGLEAPFPQGLSIFEKLSARKSQFLPEVASMASRYFEGHIDKVNSPQEVATLMVILGRAIEFDKYDTRIFNSLYLNLIRIITLKKINQLDYSYEQQELEKLFNFYLKEYPYLSDLKFQYLNFLKLIDRNDEAFQYLLTLKNEATKNPRYTFLYLSELYNFNKDLAYQNYQEIKNLNYQPRNPLEYLIILKILKNKDKELFNKLKEDYFSKFTLPEDRSFIKKELGIDN